MIHFFCKIHRLDDLAEFKLVCFTQSQTSETQHNRNNTPQSSPPLSVCVHLECLEFGCLSSLKQLLPAFKVFFHMKMRTFPNVARKIVQFKPTSDFRPIANTQPFHKTLLTWVLASNFDVWGVVAIGFLFYTLENWTMWHGVLVWAVNDLTSFFLGYIHQTSNIKHSPHTTM